MLTFTKKGIISEMKNICIMPWIAVDRNRNNVVGRTTLTPCCFYEPEVEHRDIESYWNSDETIKLRKDLLAGKRHFLAPS